MAQDKTKTDAPIEGQAPPTEAPEPTGQAPEPEIKTEAPLKPDKFEGKADEDVKKSYAELEKKFGEQSNEVAQAREVSEKMGVVLAAISADPQLYQSVENQIRKMYNQPPIEDQVQQQNQQPTPEKDDTRRAVTNNIMDDFYRRYGVDKLEADKKKEVTTKIGVALAEMLDPGGTKNYNEILSSISLERLPRYLENAYYLANKEELIEQSKLEAIQQSRENEMATIGSIPSSSGMNGQMQLTQAERATAQKMGISEENYLKRKKEIAVQTQ